MKYQLTPRHFPPPWSTEGRAKALHCTINSHHLFLPDRFPYLTVMAR